MRIVALPRGTTSKSVLKNMDHRSLEWSAEVFGKNLPVQKKHPDMPGVFLSVCDVVLLLCSPQFFCDAF